MRAALYARVSTDEQLSGYSIDAQLRACRQYIQDRNWTLTGEYVEEGRSARTEDIRKRPAFLQAMADAAAGCLDALVVHKLDRFSRNLRVTLEQFDRLTRANVAFISITEQMDYSTPQGKLSFHILGVLAQYFSDNLAQEVRKGKQERKLRGLYNGLLPFGLAKGRKGLPTEDKRPQPNGSCNWEGYLLAMRSAASGQSDSEVAATLNAAGYRTSGNRGRYLWCKDSVRHMLSNRFYLGELPDGQGHWIKGAHAAFVDAELFEAVQRVRAERRVSRASSSVPPSRRTYSLTGLLRCWYCEQAGRPGQIHITWDHNAPRATCYARGRGLNCPQRSTHIMVYEVQVQAWLASVVIPEDAVERAMARLAENRTADPVAERQRLEARLGRLKELYGWGDIERAAYVAERDEIRERLRSLAPLEEQQCSVEKAIGVVRSAVASWWTADQKQKNMLACSILSKVVVRDGQVVEIVPRPGYEGWLSDSVSCAAD